MRGRFQQAPGAVDIPIEEVDDVEGRDGIDEVKAVEEIADVDAPVVAHGVAAPDENETLGAADMGEGDEAVGDMVRLGTVSRGLSPALMSSVDPSGIPVAPAREGDMAGTEVAVAAPAQAADAVSVMPPPSNSDVTDEVGELTTPEHLVLPATRPDADVDSPGLMPGVASSVAPIGIPVGATGEPACILSGEVAPIPGVGLPAPYICAKAGLQPRTAAMTAIISRLMKASVWGLRADGSPAWEAFLRSSRQLSATGAGPTEMARWRGSNAH
jgi:hypothetical protein